MKLPTNISDFAVIRREGYLYVDKTRYIQELEKIGRYLFFIRPRRFGKSLFLSTLKYYYDLQMEDDFEQLFGDLQIGQKCTEFKSRYFVLHMNFSGLDTTTAVGLRSSFDHRVLGHLIAFFDYYGAYFPQKDTIIQELKEGSSTLRLGLFFNEIAKTRHKVYLIIDEYDHFANDIIAMGDGQHYREIVRASGFVRDFYETIKIGTQGIIDRIFITGIAPIMLDDLTSGFNISSNITLDPFLNEMMGFTAQEVENVTQQSGVEDSETLLAELKDYYNGYLFNEDCTQRVFNPDMILYFFDHRVRYGKPPKEMISDNVKTDYGRLNRLAMNPMNRETLENVIKEETIMADLVSRFSFDLMYDDRYFISLLFYMGLLTIDQKVRTRLYLKIPNLVIKTVFWEYFSTRFTEQYQLKFNTEKLRQSIEVMAYEGNVEPYLEFVQQNILKSMSNRDLIHWDEKHLKMVLLAYLNLVQIYKVVSEREIENGYIDLYLERDIRYADVKYEWLWELKYLKKSDRHLLEQVKEEGVLQLQRYATSDQFRDKTNLRQALIIFVGKDEFMVVAP